MPLPGHRGCADSQLLRLVQTLAKAGSVHKLERNAVKRDALCDQCRELCQGLQSQWRGRARPVY